MSDIKHTRLPCFQCLRKVSFEGALVVDICLRSESGTGKHCNQCDADQRCEPTPLVFSTLVRSLVKAKHDEKALRSWKESFASQFDEWHEEVVRGGLGRLHNLNHLFEWIQIGLDRDEFERLVDSERFTDAAADAMSDIGKAFYRRFRRECDDFLTRSDKLNWELL